MRTLLILFAACAADPDLPETRTVSGHIDRSRFVDAETVEALDDVGEVTSAPVDREGRFELVLFVSRRYVFTIEPGAVPIAEQDLGGPSADPVKAGPSGDGCAPPDVEACEFQTYNLDVAVGDRFRVSRFVDCAAVLGTDYSFAYEGGETWNLDAMNRDDVIEIVDADRAGGNHGDGEYRFQMIDAGGDEIDHMTIRIRDGDSDIGPGDDALAPPPVDCGEPGGEDPAGDTDGELDPNEPAPSADAACADPVGCL
jgi:hypothetical protein